MTDKYKKDLENPVVLDTLPESVQRQMHGLVGFEIKINKIDCTFILSQNRNEEDLRNIVKQLNLEWDTGS